jgi:hypothetical protein
MKFARRRGSTGIADSLAFFDWYNNCHLQSANFTNYRELILGLERAIRIAYFTKLAR